MVRVDKDLKWYLLITSGGPPVASPCALVAVGVGSTYSMAFRDNIFARVGENVGPQHLPGDERADGIEARQRARLQRRRRP